MTTSTRAPETSRIPGDELDASDARTTLLRFGRRRLAAESFRRFRYGNGFSHARALGLQIVLAVIPMTIALVGQGAMIGTCGWPCAWGREGAHLPEDDLKPK